MPGAAAKRQPLSRAEYDHLVELGEFQDRRVELLRGRIVEMSPQGAPHASAVRKLNKILTLTLKDHADVQVQAPLAVSDDSEPEPDIAIIEPGDYRSEHPTTALLVIEVADSSLEKDRHDKATLYAERGIPEYWIVNIAEENVEVYLEPMGGEYRTMTTKSHRDILRPTRLPMLELVVADIF